uniref:N-acetylgalactosaminide beta-1,3-galactosyltransferase n=1 Tax=Rhabditophanes sp. KR3021 TaxID=114890 RepID=A0AC35UAY3_9BILA
MIYLNSIFLLLFVMFINIASDPGNFFQFYCCINTFLVSDIVSAKLQNKVKVFCIILSGKNYRHSRDDHQKATWLKRCGKYVFASTVNDPKYPHVRCHFDNGYEYSFTKIGNCFKWVFKKYGASYDWFFKVSCLHYVIMENLSMFLMNKDPNKDTNYYGFQAQFKDRHRPNVGFITGGSGYVLSRASFKKLVTKGFTSKKYCKVLHRGLEDQYISECLAKLKIFPVDSRDQKKRLLFIPGSVSEFATPHTFKQKSFFMQRAVHKLENGMAYLGNFPISIHYTDANMMYVLEYLFYHAEVAGIGSIIRSTLDHRTIEAQANEQVKYREDRDMPIRNTYLKKCNKIVFADSKLGVPKKDRYLKVRKAFVKAYRKFGDDFDYFLKMENNSYFIFDNLRQFLMSKSKYEDHYFGFPFKEEGKSNYMSGSGYVLSKSALKKLVTRGFPNKKKCKPPSILGLHEDLEIGQCLASVGIKISESRDKQGRILFVPLSANEFLFPENTEQKKKINQKAVYPFKGNENELSNFPISFHPMTKDMIYSMEYVTYVAEIAGEMSTKSVSKHEITREVNRGLRNIRKYARKLTPIEKPN